MTYQVTLVGRDGIVMASDRRELLIPGAGDQGEGATSNMVKKIRIDPSGRFAWAFAGGPVSIVASGYLQREAENVARFSEGDLEQTIRECGDRAWQNGALGANPNSTLVFVDGATKRILRAKLSPVTSVDDMQDGWCYSGQTYSKASFFPQHYYSPDISVEKLSLLAAYAVVMAGEMDQLCVGGLDMAIYCDSAGRFEFVDRTLYLEHAMQLDEKIRQLFR